MTLTAALTPLLLGLDWMDPNWLLEQFGEQMFWVSVAIVFAECGLLFPILPGDSLLFSVGLFINVAESGEPGIDIPIVPALVILSIAAFAGNVVGYEIGRKFGAPLFHRNGRYLNEKNLAKTHEFFERYGNKALVLGRFVPIVRTFVTVVAGAGEMSRKRFFTWSAVGAVLWVTAVTLTGYFLGSVEFLQQNIEATLLVLVGVSLVPIFIEYWRQRSKASAAPPS